MMSVDPALTASNRRWLGLAAAIACAACGDDGELPGKYRATGTLIHDGLADEDRAGWATEIEILKSGQLREEVLREVDPAERVRLEATLRRGLAVKRRASSRLIEVSVGADDAAVASGLCNELMRTYVEYRLTQHLMPLDAKRKALAQRLDELQAELAKGPTEPPALVKEYEATVGRLRELEISSMVPKNDVRLLDPCAPARR